MASAVDSSPDIVSIDIITTFIRKACSKYQWNKKKDFTYKTFLKYIKNFAEEYDISLEAIRESSIIHTKNAICSKQFFKYYSHPPDFQNIPYYISVDDNNITTVIIDRGHIDSIITTITPDMMQLLSYLGIVRVFVKGELPIPLWTDNIIYLHISNANVIYHICQEQIAFPKYLQCFIDLTRFTGFYTNWLPPSLHSLVSACTEIQNLSPNLKYYNYTGATTNEILAINECLPIGLKYLIYHFCCKEFEGNEITVPLNTEILEIGFNRIYNPILIFNPVKILYISNFESIITEDSLIDVSGTNLTFEYQDQYECNYRQNVDIILESGIENLVINLDTYKFDNSVAILEFIKQIPDSLKLLTIIDEHNVFNLEKEYHTTSFHGKHKNKILNFLKKFPHIKVSIINEISMLYNEQIVIRQNGPRLYMNYLDIP